MPDQAKQKTNTGPLSNIKVVEFAGVGPAPLGAMMLADLGATVLRIERPHSSGLGLDQPPEFDFSLRGRNTVQLDLKAPRDVAIASDLIAKADVLIEGFRPGVMERLGLGPEVCMARNQRIIFARMTGWGQDGPLSHTAGHDLNYISITGGLAMIGRHNQPPTPPMNLVGDFGGGTMPMVIGILAALNDVARSGKGQIVDANIVDGTLSLLNMFFGMRAQGTWNKERGTNILDSGAPFYDVYPCADGKFIALAAIEDKFFALFLQIAQLPEALIALKQDPENWPQLRAAIVDCFSRKTRDEWAAIFEGSDACVSPVLDMDEAIAHPHLSARDAFIEIDGHKQPAPVPRFSRTQPSVSHPSGKPTPHDKETVLSWWADLTP
ncbi:MAG: CaiB/BaiF CoA-transferase family protein [Sulfitobacter sp.]